MKKSHTIEAALKAVLIRLKRPAGMKEKTALMDSRELRKKENKSWI